MPILYLDFFLGVYFCDASTQSNRIRNIGLANPLDVAWDPQPLSSSASREVSLIISPNPMFVCVCSSKSGRFHTTKVNIVMWGWGKECSL